MKDTDIRLDLDTILGSVRSVREDRLNEDGSLSMGGYAIHYDRHGKETRRTEWREACRVVGYSEAFLGHRSWWRRIWG